MNICSNCNTQLEDDDRFCYACGQSLETAAIVVRATDGPMPETRASAASLAEKNVQSVTVYLRDCNMVDDDVLLEMIEQEIEELLTECGFLESGITIIRCDELPLG